MKSEISYTDRYLKKMQYDITKNLPVNIKPNSRDLANTLLVYANDANYAYAVLVCAISEIRRRHPNVGYMKTVAINTAMHLHEHEINEELKRISNDLFIENGINTNPITEAAKEILARPLIDQLKYENKMLENKNKELNHINNDQANEIKNLNISIKNLKEKLKKSEEKLNKITKDHDKEIRKMEHRLIEMEKENQKIFSDT